MDTILHPQDWHKTDVVAALHKRGLSLRRLSVANGLTPRALGIALHRRAPKYERIIAAAIGVDAREIWGSRYV
ncbi:MAG: helix-turn-helix domain-containing protein [Zoogloeaceae bacterium]|jgi:Ner family transcriptional regulator|nr:helix-turn-helix domain-containing protein [Zoogloeaceae bacterium]